MTEAIIGLVGVIIGAFISAVTTFVLQKRKEYRAVRVAARLVRDDIYLVPVLIEDIVGSRNPNHERLKKIGRRVSTRAWPDQRVHLAAAMKYDEFANAGLAVNAADEFQYWFDSKSDLSGLQEEDKRYLTKMIDNLRPGLEALKQYAK